MKILNWFKKLFTKEVVNTNPIIYNMELCKSWGNNIRWIDFDTRSIVGHQHKIPVKGDFLLSKMTNGKIVKFKFVDVYPQRDPSDMFFAKVKDIGYCDQEGNLE